jgi:PAS domain-containing protein
LLIDITEENKQLDQLIESQRLLEDTSAIANIGHSHFNFVDNSIYWLDEVYRIHKYKPGESRPQLERAIEAYPPDDRDLIAEAVSEGQVTGKPFCLSTRIGRPNGDIRHVISKGQVRQEEGVDAVVFGIFQDITAQVQSRRQSELWGYLVNETTAAAVITDAKGRVTWANESFVKLSGYRLEELQGKQPGARLQGPDTDKESIKMLFEAIKAELPITIELLNYSKVRDP